MLTNIVSYFIFFLFLGLVAITYGQNLTNLLSTK